MRRVLTVFAALALVASVASAANATVLIGGSINNGNLDRSVATEINPPAPGFFLPKPAVWVNEATKGGNPWEDEMSSEPWAGPAPTPVTNDGLLDPPHPDGCGGPDCGVFWKPFSGSANELVTGHLYQIHPATPGLTYIFSGWAGAEANALMRDAEFAVEFLDAGNSIIGGSVLSLLPTLYAPNGEPFNYKEYTVSAVAPAGSVSVKARVSMIDAMANPLGGGQAFVVDDFTLLAIPEPASVTLAMLGLMGLMGLARRRR